MNQSKARRQDPSAPKPERAERSSPSTGPKTDPVVPTILDGVRDQQEQLWIKFGRPERWLWVPITELTQKGGGFARLINIDPRLLEPKAQNDLRSRAAKFASYRPALTASSPGWHGRSFVLGTGDVLAPSKDADEIIVTFAPNPKFDACGALPSWQTALGPIVAQQPLPLFGLSLAFVGPILKYTPPDYLNPLFELVGDPGTGKSTVAVAAMSVWAGNPEGTSGGGETWDFSPGRLDGFKFTHRHILLLLDEANLAGGNQATREGLTRQAIFNLTNSGVRQRSGDPHGNSHSQLAVLSTSNRRLSELVGGPAAERVAMAERMITIEVLKTRPFGILDFVPNGFESSAEAVAGLLAAAKTHWGTAGPAFVRQIQKRVFRKEERFRKRLASSLAKQVERLRGLTNSPRIQKIFALVAVAGQLARRWGILPKSWGSPSRMVRKVAQEALGNVVSPVNAIALIQAYVEEHRGSIRQVTDMQKPLSERDFEESVGFMRNGKDGLELLVPAARFQKAFLNYRQVMNDLRRECRARTESGQQTKLTIKTPKAICNKGRVYCLIVSN